jgi:hypothetical protein
MTEASQDKPDTPEPKPKLNPKCRPNPWKRLVPMIGYAIVADIALWLIVLFAIMQFIVVLVTQKANEQLARFCGQMIDYFRQILDFLTYRTEDHPFPFAPFPQPPAAPKKRPARKKAPAKSVAAKKPPKATA